jgi:hypothetical protein
LLKNLPHLRYRLCISALTGNGISQPILASTRHDNRSHRFLGCRKIDSHQYVAGTIRTGDNVTRNYDGKGTQNNRPPDVCPEVGAP